MSKIDDFFKKHNTYYSFKNESFGCFGELIYKGETYFAFSGAKANRVITDVHYNTLLNLKRKINGITHYKIANLNNNAISFYSEYSKEPSKRVHIIETPYYRTLENSILIYENNKINNSNRTKLEKLEDIKNLVRNVDNYVEDYLSNNKMLFDCVERILISSVENNYEDYKKNDAVFILKWAPCERCIEAIKGKNVYYYYKDYKEFIKDYMQGNVDYTIHRFK